MSLENTIYTGIRSVLDGSTSLTALLGKPAHPLQANLSFAKKYPAVTMQLLDTKAIQRSSAEPLHQQFSLAIDVWYEPSNVTSNAIMVDEGAVKEAIKEAIAGKAIGGRTWRYSTGISKNEGTQQQLVRINLIFDST